MLCQDIMKTNVECLAPTDTAQTAARKMRDVNVGFLPICDASGKVLGTVTDRDLTIHLVAENRPGTSPVRDVMTREVVVCSPKDDLQKAEKLMGQKQKSRILCIDADGRLAGVISLSDIAQEDEERVASTLRQVSDREAHPH